MPVLVALAVIRLGLKVLQVAFKNAPLVRALDLTISCLVNMAILKSLRVHGIQIPYPQRVAHLPRRLHYHP